MKRRIISLPLMLYALPALAQESSEPQDQAEKPISKDEIVVVAERLRGQVDTPQSPVATFDESEIQSMGVSSIGDLLGRISPQTGSGRGRGGSSGGGMPVVLLNGQRVSNFREMRNIPPEAIRKVEVLPEEVALKFGYSPDTRVVNIILKDKFQAVALDSGVSLPFRGGFHSWNLEGSLTRIAGPSRLSLTATTDDTAPLFESERNLVPTTVRSVSSDPDPQQFRTLIPDSRNFGLNAALSRGLGKNGMGGSLSLSAGVSRAESRAWQGLDSVLLSFGGDTALRTLPGPLERVSRTTTLEGGAGYSTSLGDWQFSATVDANHGETRSRTDRRADTSSLVAAAAAGTLPIRGPLPVLPPAGATEAETVSNRVENLVTMIGRPLRLPGGKVSATIKAGYTWIGFDTKDQASLSGPVSLNRGRVLGGVNLGIPLTSRRENFLGGAGDITLNLSADVSHLSDFGTLTGWTTGLTWGLTGKLGLQASYIVNETAPAISQLGNPTVLTFNVPVYDFTRNETVLVTLTGGGNPLLRRETQRDLKLGLTWQLPILSNSSMVAEYFRNRSSDVSASFPALTPEIEAAFPGRVTRDGTGRLLAIDQRPVTFFRQEGSRLRWGINLSDGFGKATPGGGGMFGAMFGGRGGGQRSGGAAPAPPAPGARPAGGPPPGGPPQRAGGGPGGRGGGMMGMMGGGGGQPGRWSLGLYHTVQFESRVLIAPGGPLLDLLNGDAIAGGGTPRHSIEANGGVFYKGMGTFFNATWKAPTTLEGSGLPGSSDLRFGSTTSVNLVMFMDFGQRAKLIEAVPFLKGARMSIRIENLLNSRQQVTDGSGTGPLSYQPDYIDPRGRIIGIQFRKLF